MSERKKGRSRGEGRVRKLLPRLKAVVSLFKLPTWVTRSQAHESSPIAIQIHWQEAELKVELLDFNRHTDEGWLNVE